MRSTLQCLIDHHGDLAADQLDMPKLAGWRDALAKTGDRGRRYINDMLQIVRAMYQWAAERGDVSQDAYQIVASVGRLRKGRSVASERERVKPVAWETVEQTLPHLSPVVQAMVMTLWHTGMRPEDVCKMRTGVHATCCSPSILGQLRANAAILFAMCYPVKILANETW